MCVYKKSTLTLTVLWCTKLEDFVYSSIYTKNKLRFINCGFKSVRTNYQLFRNSDFIETFAICGCCMKKRSRSFIR